MWELLLRMILDAVTENRGAQVEFYNRFQYTVEVSARGGSSLPSRSGLLLPCGHAGEEAGKSA